MSVFDCCFNHVVGLHRYSSLNDCGDVTYEPPLDGVPVSVPCRIEYNYKEIIDKDGNKINTVKACRRIDSLTGAFDHYEVYL